MVAKDFPEADPLTGANHTPAPLERMLEGLGNHQRAAIMTSVLEKARLQLGLKADTDEPVWEQLDGSNRPVFLEMLRAETSIQQQMYEANATASRRALDYLTGPAVIPIEGMEVAQARKMVHSAVIEATDYLRDRIGIDEAELDSGCRDILHTEVSARVLAAQQNTQAELDEKIAALSGEATNGVLKNSPAAPRKGLFL